MPIGRGVTRRTRLVACALLTAATTGCAGPMMSACTAIGHSSTLVVHLTGDVAAAAAVQLCVPQECSPADPTAPVTDGLLAGVQQTVDAPDIRTFITYGLPDTVTVRTLDVAGEVRGEVAVTPEWERTGGTPECGGPTRAEVTVPA